MNEVQANGGIDDINARYNTKMEGINTDVVFEGGMCKAERQKNIS